MRVTTPTHHLGRVASRNQNNLGPAIARVPPLTVKTSRSTTPSTPTLHASARLALDQFCSYPSAPIFALLPSPTFGAFQKDSCVTYEGAGFFSPILKYNISLYRIPGRQNVLSSLFAQNAIAATSGIMMGTLGRILTGTTTQQPAM